MLENRLQSRNQLFFASVRENLLIGGFDDDKIHASLLKYKDHIDGLMHIGVQ